MNKKQSFKKLLAACKIGPSDVEQDCTAKQLEYFKVRKLNFS